LLESSKRVFQIFRNCQNGDDPNEKPARFVISAHPDDVDLVAAALLPSGPGRAKITYCICTSGEKGTDDPT